MEQEKYNSIRSKIKGRNFENKYKILDKYLFGLSFLGNIGSIFFAFFLISPAIQRSIIPYVNSEKLILIISIITSIFILGIFEFIKRELLRNFSFDFIKNTYKIKISNILPLIISLLIIILSFYFSLTGAKNFASTSKNKNIIVENKINTHVDSLNIIYNNRIQIHIDDNNKLRENNDILRNKLAETPLNYRTVRNEYQNIVDKNVQLINNNENNISKLNVELLSKVDELKTDFNEQINKNEKDDFENIFLFICFSTIIELLIISGIYFRQHYEYKIFVDNDSLEKTYIKRERYKLLLKFLYNDGTLNIGDKILGMSKIKELVKDNSRISNSGKFIDTFIFDMESNEIFRNSGKRRYFNVSYDEALNIVDNFDDSIILLENLK